jgi:molecular chaperone GrpE (heat shock protein)
MNLDGKQPMTNEADAENADSAEVSTHSQTTPSVSDNRHDDHTIGSSSIYRLCEEIIALREINNRQHKMFEQTLTKTRDAVQASFNSFAADTQKAYQQLRQEFQGEKRISLGLLNELVEIANDLRHITGSRPQGDKADSFAQWADGVEVQARKVEAALLRHGIHPYHAIIGSPYNPALHERVGSKRMEGMGPLLVADQQEPGLASQQPEFVLRRAKVIVSE